MRFFSSSRYKVVQEQGKPVELGEGGMAVVYLGKDLLQGTQVAIKVPTVNLLSIGQNSRIYVPLKVLHPAPFHSPI